jgi:hypothetical protein
MPFLHIPLFHQRLKEENIFHGFNVIHKNKKERRALKNQQYEGNNDAYIKYITNKCHINISCSRRAREEKCFMAQNCQFPHVTHKYPFRMFFSNSS